MCDFPPAKDIDGLSAFNVKESYAVILWESLTCFLLSSSQKESGIQSLEAFDVRHAPKADVCPSQRHDRNKPINQNQKQ